MFVCTGARVYLPLENLTLPNFTMIHAGQFDDADQNADSIVDALWCQSDDSANNIGAWYQPSESNNPVAEEGNPGPLYVTHFTGQVGLYRTTGIAGFEGVYRCSIIDASGTHYNFFLGIYKTPTYHNYSEHSNCTKSKVIMKMIITLFFMNKNNKIYFHIVQMLLELTPVCSSP